LNLLKIMLPEEKQSDKENSNNEEGNDVWSRLRLETEVVET